MIAVAELLLDQMKTRRKVPNRDFPKSQQPFSSQSMEDLLTFLDEVQTEEDNCFVCVIIHNIDGPALRDHETQQYLARLAACTNIRIVASIDHVNAPLCKCSYAKISALNSCLLISISQGLNYFTFFNFVYKRLILRFEFELKLTGATYY